MEKNKSSGSAGQCGLRITRVFDAPREQVWKAWTEPERVKRWWGPKTFTAPVIKIDLRVGGKYLYAMRSAEGNDYWSAGVFREIVAPEKIIVTDYFADEHGNRVPATHYGLSDFPQEMQATVTFEEHGGKTKFTLEYPDVSELSPRDVADMQQGWNESLDKLAAELKTVVARSR